jgi:predicted amidohydrolase
MRDLRITLIQSDIYWQDPEANLAAFEEKIWTIPGPTDLIILPEMFNTGFTMDTHGNSELMNGRTFKWMKQMAGQKKAVITGSLIVWEKDCYYNRLIWMRPDGSFSFYDKKHLFRMAGEDKYFSMGNERLIENLYGWNICPFICYDLRFPAWLRNRILGENNRPEYDLAIFVANWPAARINAWDILIKSRAIENACYVAGVNRIGNDANGIAYNGHSMAVDPKGDVCFGPESGPHVSSISLSSVSLESYRKKFPVLLDADKFFIN